MKINGTKIIQSLNIPFIIGRYNHNGTYIIKIFFCNNFVSNVTVVSGKS